MFFHQTTIAMPRRNPASALLDARAALAAYLRKRPSDKLMPVEHQTIERLGSDRQFGVVWQQIEPYFKTRNDRERLMGAIIRAARMALEGPQVLKLAQSNIQGWKQAKQDAGSLHRFLTKKVDFVEGRVEIKDERYRCLVDSLSWLLKTIDLFKLAERAPDSEKVAAPYELSREFHNVRFIPSTFMKFLGRDIIDICGEPLDKTVAILAKIVLKIPATAHQARSARRPTTRRGRRRRQSV
jgi:hypothetical protein